MHGLRGEGGGGGGRGGGTYVSIMYTFTPFPPSMVTVMKI